MNGVRSVSSETKVSEEHRRFFCRDVHAVILSSLLMMAFLYLDDIILLLMKSPHGLIARAVAKINSIEIFQASRMLCELCENDMFLNVLSVVTQLLMLFVGAFSARIAMKNRPKPLIPLRPTLPKRPLAFIGLTFGSCYSVNLLFTILFGSFDRNIEALTAADNAFDFLSVVIIAPIFEEIVFRGIFFRSLEKYDRTFAVFFTAVLFGLMHRAPASVVNATVFGIFAAVACAETGSLLMGMLLHMTNNAVSFAAASLISGGGSLFLLLIPLSCFTLAMIISAVSLVASARASGKRAIIISRPIAHSTPRIYASCKVRAVLCTPWTWLFAALFCYSLWVMTV